MPKYKREDAIKEGYKGLKFHIEFMRVKHKEVHDNVAQRFKQFGIGNVDNEEKDFMFEPVVREDDAWPAPFNLVIKFKTEMASHDRH